MKNENSTSTGNAATGRVSRRSLLGASAAATAGLAGCLGLGGGESETVKIGALFPTSGAYATSGEGMKDALELAVTRNDSSAGGRDVELLVRDSGTSPDTAVPEANAMIQEENIDILMGGFSSSVCLALQDVAAREEILYFAGGGSTLQANADNCNRFSFFANPSGWQFSGAGLVAAEQGIMDSLYFVQADYAGGEGVYDGVTSVLESKTDVDVRGRALAALGNQDYSSQISKAKDSGADMIWAATVGSDTVKFVKQAMSAGLEASIIIGATGNGTAKAFSDETLDNLYGGSHFYWTGDGAEAFVSDYREEYGSPPDWWDSSTFDAAMEALNAVDRAGGSTAPDDIIPDLEGREFSWSRPTTQWRACDHRSIQPYYLLEGQPASERDDESEYWRIAGNASGERIMRSCDATGCSL